MVEKTWSVEPAAGHVTDVQLQQGVVVRGVGQRKLRLPPSAEDVDVLSGEELQALAGRQFRWIATDVDLPAVRFLDPRGQGPGQDFASRAELPAFQRQIGARCGATEERQAGSLSSSFSACGWALPWSTLPASTFTCTNRRRHRDSHGAGPRPGAARRRGIVSPASAANCRPLGRTVIWWLISSHGRRLQCRRAKILIVGSGDVARRILSSPARHHRVYAMLRGAGQHARLAMPPTLPL